MITSRQNGYVKRLRALRDKKYRDEAGEFVVEGVKSVYEAVTHGFTITYVAATEKGATLIADSGLNPEILSDDVFKSVSEEVSPQGVIAVVKKPTASADSVTGKCVFLDGVSDPANVGAIIRSAAAFGYNTVLIADGADAYSNKSVRASMGGIFRVKVLSGTRAEMLAKIGVSIVVADMDGKDLSQTAVSGSHCLAIGNEAHGVSDEVFKCGALRLSIPMQNGIESLNAAVSAGIIMFALTYQNERS